MTRMATNTLHIGAAGELLVQFRFLRNGIDSARLTTDAGVDLVAYPPGTGRALTVQVETVERLTPAGGKGDCPPELSSPDSVQPSIWQLRGSLTRSSGCFRSKML